MQIHFLPPCGLIEYLLAEQNRTLIIGGCEVSSNHEACARLPELSVLVSETVLTPDLVPAHTPLASPEPLPWACGDPSVLLSSEEVIHEAEGSAYRGSGHAGG